MVGWAHWLGLLVLTAGRRLRYAGVDRRGCQKLKAFTEGGGHHCRFTDGYFWVGSNVCKSKSTVRSVDVQVVYMVLRGNPLTSVPLSFPFRPIIEGLRHPISTR